MCVPYIRIHTKNWEFVHVLRHGATVIPVTKALTRAPVTPTTVTKETKSSMTPPASQWYSASAYPTWRVKRTWRKVDKGDNWGWYMGYKGY